MMLVFRTDGEELEALDVEGPEPDYLPLGTPDELADRLNTAMRATGLEIEDVDEDSGVELPYGVEQISFTVVDGQVELVFVTGPTEELIEVMRSVGAQERWQFFEAGSGERM